MRWTTLLRSGDWLIVVLGLAFCIAIFPISWQAGTAVKAVVKRGGSVFAELDLARNQQLAVPGPLGTTIIAVEQRRVRVASDPGPRQYCVHQGWLRQPGEIAICAPNEVSVQIVGSQNAYDSLSY